ncbi:hypothetical protein D7D52_09845 [Nocardia yunnanensis]|uniref:Uncharacterized protein n=1 Tax=Nocardia yunnanensis TaxID=2382165 RepID=A0A386ZA40_9NOCA|nr:hypothetical protein [Nocardia yunnanensis]AYF74117.1 hypothetical protein D7D52_09845 [Nocardia yunnanensis]
MRVRTFAATVATFAGLGLAGLAVAGNASAATPFVIPQIGAAGVELSHQETQSLASGPLPGLVDHFAPTGAVTVALQPDSALPQDEDYIYADMPSIVGEAASRPDGSVDLVVAPEGLAVVQVW